MEVYDYIVVGAGSSGCVVASRLSEDPSVRVLLLEAGPPANSFWVHAPAGMGRLFQDMRVNWGYFTDLIPTLGNRKVYWPRGKALGGSSAINGMVYMRGHPLDFDRWAALGNKGWGWADVLPYFLRSEANVRGASEFHGHDGPLSVSDPAVRHPASDAFIKAATHLGIARVQDLNAPPFEGVNYQQFTIRNGRRHTTYQAFVEPVRHRPNLTVVTGARTLRLLFDGNEATGVEVLEGGHKRQILAAREVIVSAGSINSPHLLMLSGIGDAQELQRHGIAPRVNAPGVGRNLQDHWFAPFLLRATPDGSYNRHLHGLRKYLSGARYLLTRGGYLALGASPLSAYVKSSPELAQPDLQLVMRPMTYNFRPSGEVQVDAFPGISAAVVLLNPGSAGHLELKSSDPLEAPAMHANYLADPGDARRTVMGMRLMRRILATEPMASMVMAEQSPGPHATSDDQLINHLKANGSCGWHQVGTCKMGQDASAVVDARLQVRGVQRLRVIDASVMPTITSGNTNAPAIMIGEKGADLIREDARPARAMAS
jgi:choline dehydrogenase